jgi:hypothetical protein
MLFAITVTIVITELNYARIILNFLQLMFRALRRCSKHRTFNVISRRWIEPILLKVHCAGRDILFQPLLHKAVHMHTLDLMKPQAADWQYVQLRLRRLVRLGDFKRGGERASSKPERNLEPQLLGQSAGCPNHQHQFRQ